MVSDKNSVRTSAIEIRFIDVDKSRFFLLSTTCGTAVRAVLFPFFVIRARQQVCKSYQKGNSFNCVGVLFRNFTFILSVIINYIVLFKKMV